MYKYILIITCLLLSFSFTQKEDKQLKIEWVDKLDGDYSFTEQWDYLEGIYLNEFDQLVCDGICDPQLDNMRDDSGKIYQDSLTKYYQLADTTHQYYTIDCESNSFEWAGTNYLIAEKTGEDTIGCYTLANAATHSSLNLIITNNICIAQIELNSITNIGIQTYKFKKGYIKIDQALYKKDILKAEFNFTFDNPENQKQDLWWKGKIYSPINRSSKNR